jgi:methylenetetrahydrofolate reductase (NADPH)
MDVTKLVLPYEPTELVAELQAMKAADPDFPIAQLHLFPLGGIGATATGPRSRAARAARHSA